MSMYLGKYRAMAYTEFKRSSGHPYVIFVDTRDVSIAPHLLAWGMWEHWVTDAIGPFCKNALFVDVGAAVGWFSVFAHYAEAKKIVAVEPNPRLGDLLAQTFAVNGIGAKLYRKAAGDVCELRTLTFDLQRICDARLFEDTRTMAGWNDLLRVKNEVVEVEVEPLDRLLIEDVRAAQSVVIKIDAEGYEPRIVLGAKEILKDKNCTAFVEHHADPTGSGRQGEMLDFFDGLGYNMSLVTHEAKLQPIGRADLDQVVGGEMLCFQRFPS